MIVEEIKFWKGMMNKSVKTLERLRNTKGFSLLKLPIY